MAAKLNYKVFGEGEPVIILHGLFGMLDNWQTFAKALAKDYMVYIVDQRDHGKSEHTNDFNYYLLAEDLKHFLEDQWIYEARFIGHSMGGKTLLQFSSMYEDLVQQMMIVDIGKKKYLGGHELIIDSLNSVPITQIETRGEAESTLSKNIEDKGVIQFLLKNLKRKKEGGYEWKMNLDLLTIKYPHILDSIDFDHSIDTSSLFVRGSKSNYISTKDFDDLLKIIPNSSLATLHAGHWVHAEKPLELLDLTKKFFQEKN